MNQFDPSRRMWQGGWGGYGGGGRPFNQGMETAMAGMMGEGHPQQMMRGPDMQPTQPPMMQMQPPMVMNNPNNPMMGMGGAPGGRGK